MRGTYPAGPGLEVCAPCRPKDLKLILTRKSQVFAHTSGSPETLVPGTPGSRRSQFSWQEALLFSKRRQLLPLCTVASQFNLAALTLVSPKEKNGVSSEGWPHLGGV